MTNRSGQNMVLNSSGPRNRAIAAALLNSPDSDYACKLPTILPLLGERAGVRASFPLTDFGPVYSFGFLSSLGIRHWAFVIGHSSLGIRHWAFVIGHSSLGIRHWAFVIGHSSLGIR